MRRLQRSKGGDPDRVLLEGRHLIEAAVAAGVLLERVFVSPEVAVRHAPWCAGLPAPLVLVHSDLLDELADADSPRGLLAVARRPNTTLAGCPRRADRPALFLEGIQDPGNLGAVARVAEAVAAAAIGLAPGSVHPFHPRALRASAGSLLRVALAQTDPESFGRHCAPGSAEWVALVPRGGADLYHTSLPRAPILALGAEGPGLSPALLARCRHRVSVPTAPSVESLNVAVAAAVVLFELQRRARDVE